MRSRGSYNGDPNDERARRGPDVIRVVKSRRQSGCRSLLHRARAPVALLCACAARIRFVDSEREGGTLPGLRYTLWKFKPGIGRGFMFKNKKESSGLPICEIRKKGWSVFYIKSMTKCI